MARPAPGCGPVVPPSLVDEGCAAAYGRAMEFSTSAFATRAFRPMADGKDRDKIMKTFSLKAGDIEKRWLVIDAEGVVLGRLAAVVATLLRGKHKPTYAPHLDCGDQVIVLNAAKVHLTGRKRANKRFYWHTGHPGGIKNRTMREILEGRFPERVVQKAVQRMIPSGPLGRRQFKNMKVYAGADHPHEAQQPQAFDLGERNQKNKRSA